MHQATRAVVFTAALVILSVLGISYYLPQLNFSLALLIIGLIFVGMPHGAMDIFLLLKTLGRGQTLLAGLIVYIAVGLPLLLLWPHFPSACFLFFIVYSLFHFADSDIQDNSSSRWFELLARAPLPFCVPYIFHKEETLLLVRWIHPGIDTSGVDGLIIGLGYLGLGLVGIHTVKGAIQFVSRFPHQSMNFLEPLVLSVLFIVMKPLYSLAIYFCFIHSVKHLVNVFAHIEIRSLAALIPFWLVPLIGLPLVAAFYLNDIAHLESGLFQYSLILLSSIALPHAILVRYGKSKGLIA